MSTSEWDLIRGRSLSEPSGRSSELVKQFLAADFKAVLQSPEGQAVLSSTSGLYDNLPVSISSSPSSSSTANEIEVIVRLVVGLSFLQAFVQVNWTGPELDFSPSDIIPSTHSINLDDLNHASIPLLTLHGEPAYHLASQPILFLLALRVIHSLPENLVTKPWFVLRTHLVHLSLLDEPVDMDPSTHHLLKELETSLPEDQDIRARYHLEQGLLQYKLDNDKPANQQFLSAAKASGLEFELSGALGKKTKYQVNALTQLVLLAESRDRPDDTEYPPTSTGSATEADGEVRAKGLPETLSLNDDTLLEETAFTKLTDSSKASTSRLAHLVPGNQPPLHPLDQSLLLSLCLAQHNNTPESGLTASQMMPFVSRVVSHPRNWSVHTTALLLRSRLESNRSRTVERSAMQLAALIDQMPTSDSAPQERLRWFHQIPLPSKWEMEKELAKRYLSLGVTRSALDIFTRLEMWEDAVACLQRMEREEEAEKIVKDLLEGRKIESDLVTVLAKNTMTEVRKNKMSAGRQAKLWCLLGDIALTNSEANKDPVGARARATECYDKAWEISGKTSSRSRRSLGSLHFSGKEYENAIACLRDAVAINPLFGRAWFTLGVCLVRLERWSEAREAFRRQVGVDEEDGEGWNNLAAVYLRMGEEGSAEGEARKSASFENKLLAWRALKQGLRHSHSNWRMWTNYMIVSIDVGELSEAARALDRIVKDRAASDSGASVDVDVLDKLVDSVTLDDRSTGKDGKVMPTTSNEGFGLLPIIERLFDQTIFTRINDSPRIWKSHARLLRWKEDWAGALEDYVRAYRCGPALDQGVEVDKEKFKEGVKEVVELVEIMQGLGPRVKREEGAKKGDWRFQARGVVRTFVGRTRGSFEDEPEMETLKGLMEELKNAE